VFSTDVEGVYTADPRKDPSAQLLAQVSYRDLERLTGSENSAPGQYRLMDGVALTILERSRVPALIIRGTAENIRRALAGETLGTAIGGETQPRTA
jgi:uridylate kinase